MMSCCMLTLIPLGQVINAWTDPPSDHLSLFFFQLLCSSMQKVLFEEEERVGQLQERVAELERKNEQLKERVGKLRHSLRKARRMSRRAERERLELQKLLKTAERRAGHHLNAIPPQHSPSRHRYTHGL